MSILLSMNHLIKFDVLRSARQSAGKRLPPNEITVKRNDLLAKRRQSIIDNKMQRAQFSVEPLVIKDTPADARRSRMASMTCKLESI